MRIFKFVKIAVTKLEEKSEGIQELFKQYGHEAVIVSTMRAAPPTDEKPLSNLAEMISNNKIDILIFTSSFGVEKLFEKVEPGKNVRIVCVGPKTAGKVKEYGMHTESIGKFSSENFAQHLGDIRGKTIGIARADVPNPELADSLKLKGAAVIFTSAKSFEFSCFKIENAKQLKVIAIGKKTADAMRKHGISPDMVGDGTLENCLAQL